MPANLEVLREFKKNILIETGTFKGVTAKACIEKLKYNKVYTIELQEYLYEEAKINLKKYINKGQIILIKGNSKDKLGEILSEIKEPVTIFLDAHIDDGNYKKGTTPDINWCPLYEELEIISNHYIKEHNILIDDVRIIENIGWGSNIAFDALINIIRKINPNYFIDYGDGKVKNDILIAHLNKNRRGKLPLYIN